MVKKLRTFMCSILLVTAVTACSTLNQENPVPPPAPSTLPDPTTVSYRQVEIIGIGLDQGETGIIQGEHGHYAVHFEFLDEETGEYTYHWATWDNSRQKWGDWTQGSFVIGENPITLPLADPVEISEGAAHSGTFSTGKLMLSLMLRGGRFYTVE